ncbi:hypothetical protein, partial [Janthinobacterium sp. MDT1-19]|uniref:hypothetical protein n=1 Tax=Janthinobacterium sp. MDT1-19 TaxID=1259339 RepID=UPI003F24B243
PALLLLLEALACMLLSVSYVLQLVKFAKQECPKKSGYLTFLQVIHKVEVMNWFVMFLDTGLGAKP